MCGTLRARVTGGRAAEDRRAAGLYNLKSDPGETNNVADKNPDVLKKFEHLLKNN